MKAFDVIVKNLLKRPEDDQEELDDYFKEGAIRRRIMKTMPMTDAVDSSLGKVNDAWNVSTIFHAIKERYPVYASVDEPFRDGKQFVRQFTWDKLNLKGLCKGQDSSAIMVMGVPGRIIVQIAIPRITSYINKAKRDIEESVKAGRASFDISYTFKYQSCYNMEDLLAAFNRLDTLKRSFEKFQDILATASIKATAVSDEYRKAQQVADDKLEELSKYAKAVADKMGSVMEIFDEANADENDYDPLHDEDDELLDLEC